MATEELDIIVRVKRATNAGLKQVGKDLDIVRKRAVRTKTAFKGLNEGGKAAEKSLTSVGKAAKKTKNSISSLNRETKKTKTNLDSTSKSGKKVAATFNDVAKKVFGVAASFVAIRSAIGFFRDSISIFTEFDDAMRQVGAVTQATNEELVALTDIAKKMGKETRFSATQAASGLRFLGLAGFEATEAIEALPGVLNLAAAGALDLGLAADIATNVLAGFGLEIRQLNRVNDILVGTATKSNSTVFQLGEAFKDAGAIVAGVGGDFEDLFAALGKLADGGFRATRAGTAIKGAIQGLLAPTREEERLLKALAARLGGVALQIKNAEGDFIGFAEVIEQLERAGIRGEEALKLFGLRAGPGMQTLINQGSESLFRLREQLRDVGGISFEVAQKMEAGIGGATRRLVAASEALKITLLETFGATVIDIIEDLRVVLLSLSFSISESSTELQFFGRTAKTVLKASYILVKRLFDGFKGLGKAIGLTGFIMAAAFDPKNAEANMDVIKKGLEEIKKLLFEFDEGPEASFAKIDQELEKFFGLLDFLGSDTGPIGRLVRKKIEFEEGITDEAKMAKFRNSLFKTAAALKTTLVLQEEVYKLGIISLDKYFTEREKILREGSKTEIEILTKAADVETDFSKRDKIDALIFAKQLELQSKLSKLRLEKSAAEKALEDKKLKAQEKILTAELELVRKTNELKLKNEVDVNSSIEALHKNELSRLEQRQNEELARYKKLKVDKALLDDLEAQQALERANLITKQKKDILDKELKDKKEAAENELALTKATERLRLQNAIDSSSSLEEVHKNELERLDLRHAEELARYQKLNDDKALIDELAKQQEIARAKLVAEQEKKLLQFRLDTARTMAGDLSTIFSDLYEATGKDQKAFFYLSKAAAIAQATIDAYVGANKALGQGGFLGIVQAGIVLAQGLANVAKIQSQNLAEGGSVKGHSPHSKADNIPINATADEFMQPVAAVKDFGKPFMELVRQRAPTSQIMSALLKRGGAPRFSMPRMPSRGRNFAEGGSISPQNQGQLQATEQKDRRPLNIINVIDPSEFSQFLNTSEGKNAVLNVLSSKAKAVKRVLSI